MARQKHLYRKRFEDRFEAERTVEGFNLFPGIDGRAGPAEVSVKEEDGASYVYVALEGEVGDPEELLAATGYERVA